MSEPATCNLCGHPMPPGEEMFNYHGYSGPCPTSATDKEPIMRAPTTEPSTGAAQRGQDRCGAYAENFPPGCQLPAGHDGDHRGGYLAPEPGWENVDGENAEYVNRITAVVREADRGFEKVGGGSRHWVRDCFLPLLNRAGLFIAHHVEKCRHCGEDIRQDADGDWTDCETHTTCDTETAPHHQPELRAGTVQPQEHAVSTSASASAKSDLSATEEAAFKAGFNAFGSQDGKVWEFTHEAPARNARIALALAAYRQSKAGTVK